MASITSDDDDVNQALRRLFEAKAKDDANLIREAATDLLEAASQIDAPTREEAVEVVTQQTDYSKGTVRDWMDELHAEATQENINVDRIVKRLPADQRDPVVYEFQLLVDGERHYVNIPSDRLTGSNLFQQKILERCDVLVEFNSWRETLNGWLEDAMIEETDEEPTTPDHAVAQAVIEQMKTMTATPDPKKMRTLDNQYLHYQSEDDHQFDGIEGPVVWMAGTAVDRIAKQTKGDLSHQRTRAILDPFMAGGTQKVWTREGGFRAWCFDYTELRKAGAVDHRDEIEDRHTPTDNEADNDDDESEDAE